MNNRSLKATWAYHDGTKHSLSSVHNDTHYLDFDNQPIPFKIYTELEPVRLSRELPESEMPALSAISETGNGGDGESVTDIGTIASIFYHSASITRRRAFPGGEMLFRAAACTGALYHIELYLVCGDLPGLAAGVYHFGAHDFGLRKLREGDYRSTLVNASGGEPTIVEAPAVVVCTGTFWRNAWKYRARSYRHSFWDSGTILANLLAICAARRVPAKVVHGFADESVNHLLGLDTQREVALSLVPLGRATGTQAGTPPEQEPLDLHTLPLSTEEVDYPAIRAIHEASSLASGKEATKWRGDTPVSAMPAPSGQMFPLLPRDREEEAAGAIEMVIQRRGSSRQFVRRPIEFSQLSTILRRATRGVPADFLEPQGVMLNDLYLVVNSVDGLPPGAYVFHRDRSALELLTEEGSRRVAGHLGLGQALPADASVNVFFLVDLKPVLDRYGNRGYRAAQQEAGIVGGKLYLAAYALRLGASGLTFFDDDVTTFFSPHAEGKSVMFLVALGVPLKRRLLRG